jgi:hypothetical protein
MKLICQPKAFHWQNFVMGLIAMFLFASNTLFAQDIKVRGSFLSDTVKIGEQTAFYLSAKYPSSQDVLFPDSTYDFAPFEFDHKKYFATTTKDGVSYDSTLYFISTYEIDSIQYLNLPVYVIQNGDCTAYYSDKDHVYLKALVKSVPDSISTEKLPLIASTQYQKVNFDFNFLIVSIVLGIVIVILILLWIFFGKRITRYLKARRLQKRHMAFIASYTKIVKDARTAFSAATTEHALVLWKKYMEQLEERPYTKLTTREILSFQSDNTLIQNLKNIDRAIYGHHHPVADSLDFLQQAANKHFERKIQEVKHGK